MLRRARRQADRAARSRSRRWPPARSCRRSRSWTPRSKKVIDGGHGVSYYWVGKNKAATLFSGDARRHRSAWTTSTSSAGCTRAAAGSCGDEFYRKELKLNVIALPIMPAEPAGARLVQAADQEPRRLQGHEVPPDRHRRRDLPAHGHDRRSTCRAARSCRRPQRGVIDCAEWVGGVEDLRLGLPQVWKYHYTPGHARDRTRCGEVIINADVWKSLTPQQQEAMRSAADARPSCAGGVQLAEAERRRHRGDAHQARHADPAHAARDPDRVHQDLGQDGRGGVGEGPVLQEGATSRSGPTPPRWCRPSASCSRPTRSRRTTTSRRTQKPAAKAKPEAIVTKRAKGAASVAVLFPLTGSHCV